MFNLKLSHFVSILCSIFIYYNTNSKRHVALQKTGIVNLIQSKKLGTQNQENPELECILSNLRHFLRLKSFQWQSFTSKLSLVSSLETHMLPAVTLLLLSSLEMHTSRKLHEDDSCNQSVTCS